MPHVSDSIENERGPTVSAVVCAARDAFDRFGSVLRHLAVGLVDQAIAVRLLSDDPRVEALALGPIQTLRHAPLGWLTRARRIERLIENVSTPAPTVVHALSHASYRLANTLAEAFDAEMVVQVTSLADCGEIARLDPHRVGRFLSFSEPLVSTLSAEMKIPSEQIELVRPGVQASAQAACFADPHRAVTIVCTSDLERGSGVDRLIAALGLLRQRGHDLMLFLLGRGRRESGLRRMVRERKLLSSVMFGEPLVDPRIAMLSGDIFVRPAEETAFTVDTLQAMGAGMLVVALPNAAADHLRRGETSVVCKDGAPETIADAIEGALHDRSTAQRIAVAAMEYVRSRHSMSAMGEHVAAVYRQLALRHATFAIRE